MTINRLAGITFLILVLIMGCSVPKGKLKTQSESDSRITQEELIDNWSDYTIRHKFHIVVFDQKNDDRKILLGGHWDSIQDQETWMEFLKANTTSDGDFSLGPRVLIGNAIRTREILGSDNQLYGFVICRESRSVDIWQVDENELQLFTHCRYPGGAP